MISINAAGQSVWNSAALSLGQGRRGGGGLLSRRLETRHRVDELGGNRWTISQCTCNRSWSDVHTNGGNKVLLVKTPGIKMAGPFARRVVGQLQVGHVQKALGSAALHAGRGTLFAARAAGTVCGASLAFLWV